MDQNNNAGGQQHQHPHQQQQMPMNRSGQGGTTHAATEGGTHSTRKVVIIALIAFLVGLLIGNISRDSSMEDLTTNTTEEQGEITQDENELVKGESATNVIVVNDQPMGSKVVVASVTLENDSWISIQEDRDGALGNILGARLFKAGTSAGEVRLMRATAAGVSYYAVIRPDDGNPDDFDFRGADDPLQDAEGNIVMAKFMTTSTEAEPVEQ